MHLITMLLFLATSLLCTNEGYKILVYNVRYGHSHSSFMGNIADILVDAGHNVTSLVSVCDPSIDDVTRKSHKIIIEQTKRTKEIISMTNSHMADFFSTNIFDPFHMHEISIPFGQLFAAQCRGVINEPALLDRLKEEKYDVMIVESFDVCGVGLSHVVEPKALITSSASNSFAQMYEEFGIPLSLSYNPSSYFSFLDIHSIWARLWNIYGNYLVHQSYYPMRYLEHPKLILLSALAILYRIQTKRECVARADGFILASDIEAEFREKYGQDFPSIEKISSYAAFTFLNSEPLIDFATPTHHRIINIPAITAKPPQPLNEFWNEILSRRSKNILISFGSLVKSIYLPEPVKASLVEAIAAFPEVTFIWKYEQPESHFAIESKKKLNNLVMTNWTPQNDLLSDDRLHVFITHGGMGSTQETAFRGVPGIFIPIFGDQPRNAGMMEHNGLGKVLNKFDLSNSDILISAIREVLQNKIYRRNAKRIAQKLAKKPFTSRELLIKYVEFAAEFGPSAALRPQSYDMNMIEYNNVDVVLFLALFVSVPLIIMIKTLTIVRCKYSL